MLFRSVVACPIVLRVEPMRRQSGDGPIHTLQVHLHTDGCRPCRLRENGHTRQQGGGQEKRVNLAAPVPVHILYMTTEVDAAGVRYLDDVYERDAKVLEGLNTRRS